LIILNPKGVEYNPQHRSFGKPIRKQVKPTQKLFVLQTNEMCHISVHDKITLSFIFSACKNINKN